MDLSQFQDFTFTSFPISHNSRYTLEFWIFTEDFTSIANGVKIIWVDHVAVVIKENSGKLGAYCFPQDYIDNISDATIIGAAVHTKYSTVRNAYLQLMDPVVVGGNWYWVRCAVSFNLAKYYVTGTAADPVIQTINPEYLYDTVVNDYPFKKSFFPNQTTSLNVFGASSAGHLKIYIRNIQAFNDYIPFKYDFRYM